jgi:hypothetical protein
MSEAIHAGALIMVRLIGSVLTHHATSGILAGLPELNSNLGYWIR